MTSAKQKKTKRSFQSRELDRLVIELIDTRTTLWERIFSARGRSSTLDAVGDHELARVCKTPRPPQDATLEQAARWCMMLDTGMRVSEQLVLELDDPELHVLHETASRMRKHVIEFCFGFARIMAIQMTRIGARVSAGCLAPDLADVHQDTFFGISKALDYFEPGRGAAFTTYAVWWIRNSAQRYIEQHSRTIRLPSHVMNNREKLLDHLHRTRTQSLDTSLFDDTDTETLARVVANEPNAHTDPELALFGDERMRLAEKALAYPGLTEREAFILAGRFVRNDSRTKVGDELGISRERVRQLEQGAIETLQRAHETGALYRKPLG